MLCEACQAKEARVHLTQKIGVPPTEWKEHLCEVCATAYQQEFRQFLQQQSVPVSAGMSKSERQAVFSKMGETMREHMAEWKRRSSQQ
jgi:protein-arginine kinase activator protein McsA